jgi:methionyl-tRNA synthetase
MVDENSKPPAQEIATAAPAPEEPRISIEDFAKVQMRVGQVLEAEKVEGSRKLMKLKVDLGTEVRQVVAGIAEAYDAAGLLNRKVVIVANLKPARLMGLESNGMIVAASTGGKPVLATFTEDVPNGALLK